MMAADLEEIPLRDLLRDRLLAAPASAAIFIDGRWLSGGELVRRQRRCARMLRWLGLRPGARLGLLLPNNEAFLLTWLASIELNVTLVPVNVNLVGESLRYIVEHADLDMLIVDESALDAYRGAFGERIPCRVVVVRGVEEIPGAESFERLFAEAEAAPLPLDPVARSDPALIIYTSGTTGLPKGVVLSRAAQRAHGRFYGSEFVRLGPGETGYTCLPLFHVTSMGFTLGCLLGGARIAIDARFNPFSFWEQVRRHNARMFPYVGAMIGLLMGRPPQAHDAANPAVRAIGSATPLDLWRRFEQRFGVTLIETYGQTELASLWFMPPPDGARPGTVGRPADRMEARLEDHEGKQPSTGTPGEIAIRPRDPLLMTEGYFRNPEATARAFRGGWYYTGDAASVDADGYYRFEGRLKDFIRRRGENIAASEIEREALSHPAVEDCAAVGVPAELGEEEIKLCVVPRDGSSLTAAELARYLRPRLASFMQPRYIEIRAALPRTATQRVQKYRLIEEGLPPGIWDRHRRARQ
jgi:crotonobetaine/carnitine-CoA ligase